MEFNKKKTKSVKISLWWIIAALFVVILAYPFIILFTLTLIPIALLCVIFKGKKGTAIGFQINLDLSNSSLIDTHSNKEIKEGIDKLLDKLDEK